VQDIVSVLETEPVVLTGAVERLPRAFLRCRADTFNPADDPIEPMAARARAEQWRYREFAAPHDPHLFDAAGTAALLNELVAS
jgi:hypothetical protein